MYYKRNGQENTEWSTENKTFMLAYKFQITTTFSFSLYEMIFNQKLRNEIILTANASKNSQIYCKPSKNSKSYNLRPETQTDNHSQYPQVLKLASAIHVTSILNKDIKV